MKEEKGKEEERAMKTHFLTRIRELADVTGIEYQRERMNKWGTCKFLQMTSINSSFSLACFGTKIFEKVKMNFYIFKQQFCVVNRHKLFFENPLQDCPSWSIKLSTSSCSEETLLEWSTLLCIVTQLACSVNLVLNTIFIFIPSPNPQTCWICYCLCSGTSSFTH